MNGYEIRRYQNEDYDSIAGLIKEFYEASMNHYNIMQDSDKKLRDICEACGSTSFVLSVDGQIVGLIAGIVGSSHLSDQPVYQELVWYVSEKHRRYGIRLLNHLEAWCYLHGIKQIVMARMSNSMPEKISKLYEAMGYKEFEIHYIKTLEG